MIPRLLSATIEKRLFSRKTVIVMGARQTGKTTMLLEIAKKHGDFLYLNCDEPIIRQRLENANSAEIGRVVGKHTLVFIDEVQRIQNSGITLKILHDHFPKVQTLVSGSSAFELANRANEPLTGRKWEYELFPVSWMEFSDHVGYLEALGQLEDRVIYGMYPDVIENPGSEADILSQLADSYLYKDLLAIDGIRKPDMLQKLVEALALQVGSEVSFNELSNMLQIDKNTVNSYIDMLEKAYVIFKVPAYSTNPRNEIVTGKKIYFYDTGIRNAIISNFNPLNLRTDKGALWENFLMCERMKYLHYNKIRANMHYWRNVHGSEIDYIENKVNKISAFEFKWNRKAKVSISKAFIKKYKTDVSVIHSDNFMDFISGNVQESEI